MAEKTRGELRILASQLIQDESFATFAEARIDAALNIAANLLTLRTRSRSSLKWGTQTYSFTTVAGTYSYEIKGEDRYGRHVSLLPRVSDTGALGRRLWDNRSKLGANIIRESREGSTEYRNGYDNAGRMVAFISNHIGVNEVQTITLTGSSGGTFTITYDGQTTGTIAHNADTATLQTALEALSNIAAGDVVVTGSAGAWVVTFQGNLKFGDRPAMTVDVTNVTGTPVVTVTETTKGVAKYKVNFLAQPAGTWDFKYLLSCRSITPGVDATNDALVYDTIHEDYHELIPYRAALTLLGLNEDSQDSIAGDYRDLFDAMKRDLGSGYQNDRIARNLWR